MFLLLKEQHCECVLYAMMQKCWPFGRLRLQESMQF